MAAPVELSPVPSGESQNADPFAVAERPGDPKVASPLETGGEGPLASAAATTGSGGHVRQTGYDPEQTSWESPFDVTCWMATGWEFNGDAMLSGAEPASAMFRRPYRRMMLDCRMEPLPGAAPAEIDPFEVRLALPGAAGALRVTVHSRSLVVTDDTQGEPLQIREVPLAPAVAASEPAHLRVAATGNRVVVSWNGRIALTCNQPAAHSGHEFTFAFVTGATGYRVTALRIEGE